MINRRTAVLCAVSACVCGLAALLFIVSAPRSSVAQTPPVDAAVNWLRDAKTDDEKEAAKAALRKVLTDVFAADMQARETQAAEIEARLAKLRQQYDARQKAKDEIIDRQLQVLEQDAAGLGFPDTGAGSADVPAIPRDAPFDPQAVALAEEFMKGSDAGPQEKIAQLVRAGHFVGSPDGKMYAYVETNAEELPTGTAQIRVCDAHTGKRIAATTLETPVGKLKFFKHGVATLNADGKPIMRVVFERASRTDDLPATDVLAQTLLGSPQGATSLSSLARANVSTISEYSQLRNQYKMAKYLLNVQENPDAPSANNLRSSLEEANRLIDSKLRLLALDLKTAEIALRAAESNWQRISKAHEKGFTTQSQADEYRATRDTAQVDVERAKTLYELFKSIKEEPPAGADAESREE